MAANLCQLIVLVTLPVLALAGSTQVLSIGKCPDVRTKSDFDPAQYAGKWYPYVLFDTWPQYGFKCEMAEYILRGPNDIKVVNSGYLDVEVLKNRLFRIPIKIEGSALAPDTVDNPASLVVSFFGPPDASRKPDYLLLDTDYTNYAVVYSCVQDLFLKIESAWILTRERGVAPTNLEDLKRIVGQYGADVSQFKKARNDDC